MNKSNITDFLTAMKSIVRLQTSEYKRIGAPYDLTAIDVSIIVFLSNNPTKKRASDIVDLKGLSKGNVSLSIDNLSRKGYIRILPDINDKRNKNLELADSSKKIIDEVFAMYESYDDIFNFDNEYIIKAAECIVSAGERARNVLENKDVK